MTTTTTADNIIGLDWTSYSLCPAPWGILCQFRRRNKPLGLFTFVARREDFLPEFNINGLEWKLTGIGKEQLAGMDLAVRQQLLEGSLVSYYRNLAFGNTSALGASLMGGLGAMGMGMLCSPENYNNQLSNSNHYLGYK